MNSLKNNGSAGQSPSGTILYIRYMVSLRCNMIAKDELNKLGINYRISTHGAIVFPEGISSVRQTQLKKNLQKSSLDLLDVNESLLIDKIISTITEVIHSTDSLPRISFKEVIHDKLDFGSEPILKIFTEVKGISITHFIIQQKIERAKELLLYDDLTLAEIADKLYYRNEHYFVSQFVKFTGLQPSYFKKLKEKKAQTQDSV